MVYTFFHTSYIGDPDSQRTSRPSSECKCASLWLRQKDLPYRLILIGQQQACLRPSFSLCACRHAGPRKSFFSALTSSLEKRGSCLRGHNPLHFRLRAGTPAHTGKFNLCRSTRCACWHAGAHARFQELTGKFHRVASQASALTAKTFSRRRNHHLVEFLLGTLATAADLQVRTCVKPPSPAPSKAPVEKREGSRHISTLRSRSPGASLREATVIGAL